MSISQAERLVRIETLLETGARDNAKILAEIAGLKLEIATIKTDLAADKEDLAKLKNRGAGILIGIALVGAVIGAKVRAIIETVATALH